MPAVTTHYSFALDVMKDPGRTYKEACLVGAQGTDPFFFFGRVPWIKREHGPSVASTGPLVHHMDFTLVYKALMEYANDSPDKELLYSHIEGLFLHYVLDRTCHPYVFSLTGNNDGKKEHKVFSVAHIGFETVLDCLIGHRYNTFTFRPQKMLKIDEVQLKAISKMWAYAIGKTLKLEGFDDDSYYHAVKDYQRVLRITNTPHFFSKILVRFMGKISEPYAMHIPARVPKKYRDIDFLNEKREPWPHPAWGDESTKSFMDLWQDAKDLYEEVLLLLADAKRGVDIEEKLRAFIANIDHDGDHPGDIKKHFKICWPELRELIEKDPSLRE